MKDDIASLTAEQAERAVLLVYDLLPAENWARNQKPAVTNLRALAERMEENAPSDLQPFLRALHIRENAELRGKVAKEVLDRLSGNDAVRPYVDQAVAQSRDPHMSIPSEAYPYLLGFAALCLNVHTPWFDIQSRAPELVGQLTEFVKALPAGIVQAVAGSKSAPSS